MTRPFGSGIQPTGPAIHGPRHARLDGEQAHVAARALARRHRILQAIWCPRLTV